MGDPSASVDFSTGRDLSGMQMPDPILPPEVPTYLPTEDSMSGYPERTLDFRDVSPAGPLSAATPDYRNFLPQQEKPISSGGGGSFLFETDGSQGYSRDIGDNTISWKVSSSQLDSMRSSNITKVGVSANQATGGYGFTANGDDGWVDYENGRIVSNKGYTTRDLPAPRPDNKPAYIAAWGGILTPLLMAGVQYYMIQMQAKNQEKQAREDFERRLSLTQAYGAYAKRGGGGASGGVVGKAVLR